MPLGRPSITTPNALQLQRVQQSIANIRERFRNVEAYITSLEGLLTGVRLAQASGNLSSALAGLDRRLISLEGADPFTLQLFAADDTNVGDPVRVSGLSVVSLIDPDDPLDSAAYLGIAASSTLAGGEIAVRLPGGIVEVPGAAFTVGATLYAAPDGGLTEAPIGERLPVGAAISATEMAVGYGFVDQGNTIGGVLPVVTGEVPPVLVYLPDGNLVYVEIG